MQNPISSIKSIYIDETLSESFVVKNTLENIREKNLEKEIEIVFLEDPSSFLKKSLKKEAQNQKTKLLIYKHKGSFLSSCPGSDGMVCCQYFVINLGVGLSF